MAIKPPKPNHAPVMQTVFDKNKYDLSTSAKKSRAWFQQQVLLMSKQQITPGRLLRENPSEVKTSIMPGRLYMFAYDPKLKAELPYYDRFPLVFPFRKVPGGFLGINMHYLPYDMRIKLLDKLMSFASNKNMDETTKLKYSWAVIDGVSRYSSAIPCVKHYLSDHVRSQFRHVPANDWATAMLLPVEKFVKAPKEMVWQDSKRKIG
jgi:hypothetical protein